MNFVLTAVVLCLGAKSIMAGNHGYGPSLTPQLLVALDASLALHGHSKVGSLALKSGHGLVDRLNHASLSHGQYSGHGGGIALSSYGGHGGGYGGGYGIQALNLGQIVSAPVITKQLIGGPVLTKQIIGAPVYNKQIIGAPVLSRQVVGAPVISGSVGGHGGGNAVVGAQIVAAPVTFAAPLKDTAQVISFGTPTYKSFRQSAPLRISTVQAGPGIKSIHAAQLGGFGGGHGGHILSGLSLGGLGGYGGYGLHGLNLGVVGHGW